MCEMYSQIKVLGQYAYDRVASYVLSVHSAHMNIKDKIVALKGLIYRQEVSPWCA